MFRDSLEKIYARINYTGADRVVKSQYDYINLMNTRLEKLLEYNLYLRFPKEFSFNVKTGEPNMGIDEIRRFLNNHDGCIVDSEEFNMRCRYKMVMVDNKGLFKINIVQDNLFECSNTVNFTVVSLDGNPVVNTIQELRQVMDEMGIEITCSNESLDDKLKQNLDFLYKSYNLDVLNMQLIEEMGELLQAISKCKRANGHGQPTPVTPEEARKNFIEEVAGVQVMLYEIIKKMGLEDEVRNEILIQTDKSVKRTIEK